MIWVPAAHSSKIFSVTGPDFYTTDLPNHVQVFPIRVEDVSDQARRRSRQDASRFNIVRPESTVNESATICMTGTSMLWHNRKEQGRLVLSVMQDRVYCGNKLLVMSRVVARIRIPVKAGKVAAADFEP